MTFTQAFTPALNKDGFARCEFVGHEIKSGKKKYTNEKTGEVTEREWELINLIFKVKGLARGTSKDISITTNLAFNGDTDLDKALAKLGFLPPDVEIVEDEDGFAEIATDEDEDGFAQSDNDDSGIQEFLNSIIGNVYIAKVGKTSKESEGKNRSYWEIDVDSLKLLKKAE